MTLNDKILEKYKDGFKDKKFFKDYHSILNKLLDAKFDKNLSSKQFFDILKNARLITIDKAMLCSKEDYIMIRIRKRGA